jgi:hypothetical protein
MKTFRIYIWKDIKDDEMFKDIVKKNKKRVNDYFTVMIFDKYEEMYNKVDNIEKGCENLKEDIEHNYGGRTLICRKQLYEDDKPEIWDYSKAQGFIFLCEEDGLTFNTVSHEVAHAVIGYMGAYFKNKINFRTYEQIVKNEEKDVLYEELFCYITGSLNNQIVVKV